VPAMKGMGGRAKQSQFGWRVDDAHRTPRGRVEDRAYETKPIAGGRQPQGREPGVRNKANSAPPQ